jgi:hypothetical protein
MTNPIVKTLNEELVDDIERKLAIIGFGLPFNELLGHPRDMLVIDLPKRLAPTQKGRRISVQVRP